MTASRKARPFAQSRLNDRLWLTCRSSPPIPFAEAAYERADTKPPAEWPQRGSISFDKALMSYRPGLPPVLKGISLEVEGGTKIGVVGRTGWVGGRSLNGETDY